MMQRRCHWTIALFLGLSPPAVVGAPGRDDTRAAAVSENPLAAQPLDYLSATRDRPLFSPSRRPPPPPPPIVEHVTPPPPPVAPPRVVLLGVVTDDSGAWAVVRSGSPEKTIRARLSEQIEGWNVTQIEPRRLMLCHDDRSVSFALFANQNGKDSVVQEPAPAPAAAELQNIAQQRLDRRDRR
jgi:hypothetical protein